MRGKRVPNAELYATADGAARPLPCHAGRAHELLEHSGLARDRLGGDLVAHCVALRRAAQVAAVTDWKTSRYVGAS